MTAIVEHMPVDELLPIARHLHLVKEQIAHTKMDKAITAKAKALCVMRVAAAGDNRAGINQRLKILDLFGCRILPVQLPIL